MATIDFTIGVSTAPPWDGLGKITLKKQEIDVDLVTGTPTNADVYTAMDIPAGTLILYAWFVVDKANTGTAGGTVSLGDTAAVDTWVTAATVAIKDVVHKNDGEHALLYTVADALKLVVATQVLVGCKITVYALCVDLTNKL
jgi:hypothetical protein